MTGVVAFLFPVAGWFNVQESLILKRRRMATRIQMRLICQQILDSNGVPKFPKITL